MTASAATRLLVGEIGPAHGVRGQVKMRLYLDDPDLVRTLPGLYTTEQGPATIKVILAKEIPNGWIASIHGISDRNAAEKLRGQKLYIDRDALPDLDSEDEDGVYYAADLIGLTARDDNGRPIGTVVAVENFGASDLLDIKPTTGHNFYVPFTDDYVPDIDLDAGTVTLQNFMGFLPDANDKPEPGANVE